jgi:hypothetical protein
MKRLTIFLITCVIFSTAFAQENISFKFNKAGKFKIAQFSDLHWKHGSDSCEKTIATIQAVLAAEKPDIAILTGDVVWQANAREAWPSIIKIFEAAKMPFAVVFGNHDSEAASRISRPEIVDILLRSPYFVGEKGPEDIHGCGNYVLPVLESKSNKTAALLYCFDSNDYTGNYKLGNYAPIYLDQVMWYRQQSEHFTSSNNGKPLPALAFFHIPLQEYNFAANGKNVLGNKKEGVGGSRQNTGLFSSFLDKGDVMGVFVGHNHNNDYIGQEAGIALAFGRTTGADAYGNLERGGRIIELEENDFVFNTWIRTPSGSELLYYYPSGISGKEEESATYLPAQKVNPKKNGVNYTYYEGEMKSMEELSNAKKIKQGTMKTISIKESPAEDHFAYEFHSWIKIPEKGVYQFSLKSDDGSCLSIDNTPLIDIRRNSSRPTEVRVALEAGFHELKLLYFEDWGEQFLDVEFLGKNIKQQILPENLLFVE